MFLLASQVAQLEAANERLVVDAKAKQIALKNMSARLDKKDVWSRLLLLEMRVWDRSHVGDSNVSIATLWSLLSGPWCGLRPVVTYTYTRVETVVPFLSPTRSSAAEL